MVTGRRILTALPPLTSAALILAACGGAVGGTDATVAVGPAPPAASVVEEPLRDAAAIRAPAAAPAIRVPASAGSHGAVSTAMGPAANVAPPRVAAAHRPAGTPRPAGKAAPAPRASPAESGAVATGRAAAAAAAAAANRRIYEEKNGATDVGVTKTDIKLGTVSMHGMALGNVVIAPIVRGIQASLVSINDRGGILGRRLSLSDCDDGPGDVARSKSCLKKLVGQDKIFSLLAYSSWASASIHDDLAQNRLPAVGTWAYSQTEWQDPYMFPTHMSMIHEAMAGANWVRDAVRPKTYGLFCLTSPEMQLACDQVEKILDAAGMKLVKRIEVGISETSMSAQVVAMRAANPDHVVHYVINAATLVKFMIEAQSQNYFPPMGISGNHAAGEVVGSLIGRFPVGRYWTNTTYKLWGSEFMATMNKYARGNKGTNHHIVQASYVGAMILEQAAREVGPNLTRARLMAALANGRVWHSDASMDQKFSYAPSERFGDQWDGENGQGREFMYKYTSVNTVANPDGSPSGFEPDPRGFVIHTR
jgi:ABC-type branched-subunit amino acid transport system substrate-binding protein